MPIYVYKAKDVSGTDITGTIEAANEADAEAQLKERGLTPTGLEMREGRVLDAQFTFLQRVTVKDIVLFSRQLAVMVGASVALVRALRTTARQTKNPKLRSILIDVSDEVEGGLRLSEALAKHPKLFSEFFVNMIRSGETSGKLDEVLQYLADQVERDYDLRSRVRGAMIYPIFVLAMLFVVGTIMMIFVVPKLTSILRESGVELPISTRVLIGISDFFVGYWYLIIGGVAGAIVAIRYAHGTPGGRKFLDLLLLKIPIFGPLLERIYVARLTHSLGTLIGGGVDMVTSLKVASGVVGNEVYRESLLETVQDVAAGNTITSVWRGRKEYPDMITQMVAVGEETGRLQQVLDRMTQFYTREINALVDNLSTAIEPVIMVVMGVAVGGMVAAIILPMYTLAQQM